MTLSSRTLGTGHTDRLFGNLGADTFDFTDNGFNSAANNSADHIADMTTGTDKIDVTVSGGTHYTEVQGDNQVTSVTLAATYANTHNVLSQPSTDGMFGTGTGQGNVVFVAGATDGYLLVDANNDHVFNTDRCWW